MDYIMFFVNVFTIPSLIFLFSYLWQSKTTKIKDICIMYFLSLIISAILSSLLLFIINFLFEQNYTVFTVVYSVASIVSTCFIALIMTRFNITLKYKTDKESDNEEK